MRTFAILLLFTAVIPAQQPRSRSDHVVVFARYVSSWSNVPPQPPVIDA